MSNKITLSKNEEQILKLAIEEYGDLFPRIIEISQKEFMTLLEKYIEIDLVPKNIILPNGSLKKILNIIQYQYYQKEYDKINQLIHSIDSITTCEKFKGTNFFPHCKYNKEPIHICGRKMFNLNNLEYLLCLNCKKIYHPQYFLLYCKHCQSQFYSGIDDSKNEEDKIIKPATWVNYHCYAIINEVMTCPNCNNTLYLNLNNRNLLCKNCKFEINELEMKWKCIICQKYFSSEARIFNPFEYKIMKIVLKETIIKGIEAKPYFVPCCDLTKEEIEKYKFYHKKQCNGIIYKGLLNNKSIVVCSKCQMLNYYERHNWLCPICKQRFRLKDYINKDNEITNTNILHFNDNELNNNNDNNNNNNDNKFIARRPTSRKSINSLNSNVTSLTEVKKGFQRNMTKKKSSINLQYKKMKDNSVSETNDESRRELSDCKVNEIIEEIKKNPIPNKPASISPIKKRFLNENLSPIKEKRRYSNININLNFNLNISNKSSLAYHYMNHQPIKKDTKKNKNSISTNLSLNSNNILKELTFKSDDYNIINQIGEGTFGKIYKVEGPNKIKYAMKKILANSKQEINALENEYEMLLSLSPYNLNLVNIYGIETKKLDKTTYVMYVLMDLAIRDWEKEIMFRNSKKNYYTENELIKILKELIHTFSELQKHKISHRDIKPENILLFDNNSFRIADFGEAKELMTNNRATIKQTIRGTELYMSPILFRALQNKTHPKYTEHNTFKSDVFSLGLCILLAATLTFNSLCDIRELNDSISIKMALGKYLNKKYSNKFNDFLYSMLEIDEKNRDDFIELDKKTQYL